MYKYTQMSNLSCFYSDSCLSIQVQAERSGICTEHWSPERLEKWAFEGFIPKSETVSFKSRFQFVYP